jgi:protein SCO1/2
MRSFLPRLVLICTALLVFACNRPAEEAPLAGARLGGPFALVDQDGHVVRDSDFAGRYRIVYFGFTFCPDVCPTDLQVIGQGMRLFEKAAPDRAARVQPIFITVDPKRDTPAVLKPYVGAFYPRLIGLTGTQAQIDAVRKEFAIYASERPLEGGGYTMDHSRQAILFGPKGEPIAILRQDQGPQALVEDLDRWVR